VGDHVDPAVLDGLDGRPVLTGGDLLVHIGLPAGVAGHHDHFRVPGDHLLQRHRGHPISLLEFDVRYVARAHQGEHLGVIGTLGIGVQPLAAFGVVETDAILLGQLGRVLLGLPYHLVGVRSELFGLLRHAQDLADEAVGVAGLSQSGIDQYHRSIEQTLDALGVGYGRLVYVTDAQNGIRSQLDDLLHVARRVLAEPAPQARHRAVFGRYVLLLLVGGRDVPSHQELGSQRVHQIGPGRAAAEDLGDPRRDGDLPARMVGDGDRLPSGRLG